jgi:hypothetical protein
MGCALFESIHLYVIKGVYIKKYYGFYEVCGLISGGIKIKKFILGLIIGLVFSAGFYFMRVADTKLHVDVGRMLDQDIIYLADGTRMKCWVAHEGERDILVETKEGTFTLPRSVCLRIEKNVFLKFVRNAI